MVPDIHKLPAQDPKNQIACPFCHQFREGWLFEVSWAQGRFECCDQVDCINQAVLECTLVSQCAPIITPILGFCKCCHGKGWFPDNDPDHRCPGCRLRKCERCEESEGVELESSRTMYDPGPLTFWDRILLDGEDPPDPNRPFFLCRSCAADHHSFWDEQWAEYHSSIGI